MTASLGRMKMASSFWTTEPSSIGSMGHAMTVTPVCGAVGSALALGVELDPLPDAEVVELQPDGRQRLRRCQDGGETCEKCWGRLTPQRLPRRLDGQLRRYRPVADTVCRRPYAEMG